MADADGTRRTIEELVARHTTWRASTLNLIASENVLSPSVLAALGSDIEGRYADYPGRDPTNRRYRGNRYIAEIEAEATQLARELFRARYVELRAIAGHLAGLAVILAVCRPGDLVLELDREGGGHREAGRLGVAPLISLDIGALPFDAVRFNVNPEAAVRLIEQRRPRLVILGSSHFLFPHPVAALAASRSQDPRFGPGLRRVTRPRFPGRRPLPGPADRGGRRRLRQHAQDAPGPSGRDHLLK